MVNWDVKRCGFLGKMLGRVISSLHIKSWVNYCSVLCAFMEPFFSQVAIEIRLAIEVAQSMRRNVSPSLIIREDELKFKTIRTKVNRPGLNGIRLGSCKLCRKLGGGRSKFTNMKYLLFSNANCILFRLAGIISSILLIFIWGTPTVHTDAH